ncbi:ribonuclease J [Williamsoniiplasma luminosum]|uniref:RNase J family beta-CASP ribonuclease n=1 Tax=Williamsoniiplasma luminosum TaxID=214888 RepID=A0A2S0NJW8_9MOLU|nr:ribonuclease J [Williamsoniiplasma luminosum]AVP49305.1 MAG: RNase J family beta-CASP ribonuclease [Williamsoniiplasma luminosum]
MSDIRFFALGGQDERGKNLYILEVDNDLFILDAGIKFPEKGIFGVDVVIPNFEFLKENKERIKGIFISNCSAYNMGSVVYLCKEINLPIYCNEITSHVLKIKAQRSRLKNIEQNLNMIQDKQILKFGNVKVEVFRTTSSTPQSFGYAFHTDKGIIVYAGDYIIDGQEQSYFSTDFRHLSNIGEAGVLALISDAETASRSGFTVPNHTITNYISAPFKEKKTKIAVGLFEEDIFKLGEIVTVAKENGRKIAVYGDTMKAVLESNLICDNFCIKPEDLISNEEYMKSENGVLIIAGNGDVLYSKLAKIANGNDNVVEFGEKDLIIIATPPAPGIEKRHAQILDELARTDARVVALSDKNIWSMHASYEDIKVMTSIMKPKYFVPIKSLYKDFLRAEQAAIDAGVESQNVGIIDNGEILILSKNHLAISEENIKKTNDVYVNGFEIADIGNVVLNERKQLATDGVIIVGATLDARNKELISLLDIQIRGVIYIKDDGVIFNLLQKAIESIIIKGQEQFKENPKAYDIAELKKEMVSKIRSTIKQESGKQPMALVIINEIDEKEYVPHVRASRNVNNFKNYKPRNTTKTNLRSNNQPKKDDNKEN